jgi:peptide/nickel transport system substrate-binding protein
MKYMKNVRSILLLGILAASFLGIFTVINVRGQETESVLIYATGNGPVDMDIANSWDSASGDVIDQVVETLVAYDLADPLSPIIPRLATSWSWNTAVTELTMNLRQGVTFHNGNPFNATAVQWNFDRLYHLIDIGESQLGELYVSDGVNIVKNVTIVSNYVVKFVLNFPYAPFLGLLTFSGSGIIAPGSAPADTLLDYGNVGDDMIGTGPFMFENYTTDDNVQLKAFTNWWHGVPRVDRVVFQVYSDANARNSAMLTKEVSFLADPLPELKAQYQNDTELVWQDGPPSLVIQYVGMNNKAINQTYRQAASWAFNYTYALDEIMLGAGTRLHGPIPDGMRHYDGSLPYITQNVTMARQILIDAGLAPQAELNNNTWWTLKAASGTPINNFTYTYNTDNLKRNQMGQLLKSNLADIGINLYLNGTTWADFLYMLYDVYPNGRDLLGFYFVGWGPDFNDPDNYIAPLYSNTSSSNGAQVNDPNVQGNMTAGRVATDENVRATIYRNLQDYMQNELCPWIYVYQGYNLDAWYHMLQGYHPNALGKVYFGDCYFGLPGAAIPIDTMTIALCVVSATTLLVTFEVRKFKKRN